MISGPRARPATITVAPRPPARPGPEQIRVIPGAPPWEAPGAGRAHRGGRLALNLRVRILSVARTRAPHRPPGLQERARICRAQVPAIRPACGRQITGARTRPPACCRPGVRALAARLRCRRLARTGRLRGPRSCLRSGKLPPRPARRRLGQDRPRRWQVPRTCGPLAPGHDLCLVRPPLTGG